MYGNLVCKNIILLQYPNRFITLCFVHFPARCKKNIGIF